ncbi:hypothetical protein ACVXHB_24635 [Escherichia coli]
MSGWVGHLALGLAKVSKQPGGGDRDLRHGGGKSHPAPIEAGLTGETESLNRRSPAGVIDCGANQELRQPGCFASHPTHSISLPRPTRHPARWLVDH